MDFPDLVFKFDLSLDPASKSWLEIFIPATFGVLSVIIAGIITYKLNYNTHVKTTRNNVLYRLIVAYSRLYRFAYFSFTPSPRNIHDEFSNEKFELLYNKLEFEYIKSSLFFKDSFLQSIENQMVKIEELKILFELLKARNQNKQMKDYEILRKEILDKLLLLKANNKQLIRDAKIIIKF